jgi:hypothetical protein
MEMDFSFRSLNGSTECLNEDQWKDDSRRIRMYDFLSDCFIFI